MQRWEYAQLRLTCDPGKDGVPVEGWLALPGDESWQKLGVLEESRSTVNRLGSEGWEMVGSPTSQNAVFTYKAANDIWHDRAYWVSRDYWFKRPVEQ
jgi:hypothetical protein